MMEKIFTTIKISLHFTFRDYKIRFRRTFFAIIWFLFPVITLIGTLIFLSRGLELYDQETLKQYLLRFSSGLIFWQLFNDSWILPLGFVRRSRAILISNNINPFVLTLSGIFSALISFLLKLPIIFFILIWFDISIFNFISILPLSMLLLILMGASFANFTIPISLGLLDIKYSSAAVSFFLLFSAPIFYNSPTNSVLLLFNSINPFTYIIPPLQSIIIGNNFEYSSIILMSFFCLLFFIISSHYFLKKYPLSLSYIGH